MFKNILNPVTRYFNEMYKDRVCVIQIPSLATIYYLKYNHPFYNLNSIVCNEISNYLRFSKDKIKLFQKLVAEIYLSLL